MITISFDETTKAYAPGESIAGTISWSKLNAKTNRLEVRLIWYTEGKGDRDVEVIDVLALENPDQKGEFKFQFVAPTRPFSFSAKLISVLWAIEVVQFPTEDGTTENVIISPSRSEVILEKSITEHVLSSRGWFHVVR